MCIELWIVIEVNGNIKNIDVFCIVGDGLFEFDQWGVCIIRIGIDRMLVAYECLLNRGWILGNR